MKIYIVYTTSGDDNSEVLFDGTFLTNELAEKHIIDTYTIPRRYAWSVKELEINTEWTEIYKKLWAYKMQMEKSQSPAIPKMPLVKCHGCGSMVSAARYKRPRR